LIIISVIQENFSGKAEVECGENTIEIVFLTESVFQGRIYVLGHSNDERCVSRDTGRRTTSITVRKDQCGVVVTRSVSSIWLIQIKFQKFSKSHIIFVFLLYLTNLYLIRKRNNNK
uniref:ZP domain-containing protein n=1 Tax=Thelazia callipaeda TaxID=103827 RepID=A0A0N5D4U6_THECL